MGPTHDPPTPLDHIIPYPETDTMWGKDLCRRLRKDVDELFSRLERLQAQFNTLETTMLDLRDQLNRSYQRLLKTAQRAEKSKTDGSDSPESPRTVPGGGEVPMDPYSRKLELVRRQGAVLPGTDE